MNKSRRISVILACAMLGCSDSADTSPARTPVNPPSEAEPSVVQARACGIDGGIVVTRDGIGALRVGATMTDIRARCGIVRDGSGRGVEGMPERRIAVDLGRDTVDAVVVDDRVWRIHVDGPAFRTTDGLGVGTTVAELRKDRVARVLAGEGSMFVTLADQCGLSFELGGVAFGPERPASELPADARVVEVLVFGCESPQP